MVKKNSDWEKELEKKASKARAKEKTSAASSGNKMSIQGGKFTLGGQKFGREFKGVIVDYSYRRAYFKGDFVKGKPATPVCFAVSEDGEDMRPHRNAIKAQSRTCETCPMNEWGSAKNGGKGKACGDRRMIGIIHADDLDDPSKAEIAFLEIPPGSLKPWAQYLEELQTKLKRPPHAVITKFFFADQSTPQVLFEVEEKIGEKSVVEAIEERQEEIKKDLLRAYEAQAGKRGKKDEDGEDEEDEDEGDEDEEDEDEEDEDEGDEEDEDEEDEDEEDEDEEDEDEEDEEDADGEDEDEDEKPKRGRKKVAAPKKTVKKTSKPRPKRVSRFSKKK